VGSEYTENNKFSVFDETVTSQRIVSLISILIFDEMTEDELIFGHFMEETATVLTTNNSINLSGQSESSNYHSRIVALPLTLFKPVLHSFTRHTVGQGGSE